MISNCIYSTRPFSFGRGNPPGELEHPGFRSSCRLLPRGMKKSLRIHAAYDVMLASGQTCVVSSCILFVSSDGQSDLRRNGPLSSTLKTTKPMRVNEEGDGSKWRLLSTHFAKLTGTTS